MASSGRWAVRLWGVKKTWECRFSYVDTFPLWGGCSRQDGQETDFIKGIGFEGGVKRGKEGADSCIGKLTPNVPYIM